MGLGDKWKNAGKNIGGAFANFGKAVGKTAKVAFTDEKNEKDENGETELGKAWKQTGKGFANAGESIGEAAEGTVDKVVGKEDEEEKEENKNESK